MPLIKKISAIIFILWQNGISSICWRDKGGEARIAEVALRVLCRKRIELGTEFPAPTSHYIKKGEAIRYRLTPTSYSVEK